MRSIRGQLTRNLLAITLVLLAGGGAALYLAARNAAIQQFDFTLRAKAMALSTMTVPSNEGVRVEFSDHFFPGFEDTKPRDFFEVWTAEGIPLARSESLGRSGELPHRLGTLSRPQYWNLPLPTHRAGRAIGFAFQPKAHAKDAIAPKENVGLVVASDREELDETLWGLLAIAGTCAVLLVAATVWLVPRVLRSGLQPLDQLAHATSQIEARSLSTRIAVESLPEELLPIANRLNDLLTRLERSFERERRFSADLAHELRTPLAELRSLAECALKWPDSRDRTTDRETLAIAQQMERLVGFILALARAEDGELPRELAPIVLEDFVREVWRRFDALAEERRLKISFELSPTVAMADEAVLRSVLTNLFENAVDYTPAGGALEIRLHQQHDVSILEICNDAPDLRPGDMANLFDRFWRKEAARTGGKHVGLGLSLARGFAETMGWSLTAKHDGRRITFTLRSAVRASVTDGAPLV